jgi:hypothetical protein
MFDQTKTRRSWLSHLFSSQHHRVFLLLLIFISTARADTPTSNNAYTELPRDKNSPINTLPFNPPAGETDWKEFFRNVHGSYGLSFMGPRIAGSGNETYNIFIPDVAPVQLSHSWQLGVQVNPDLQLGFSVNSIQNIADNVAGKNGFIRGRTFETYDPEIYANLPNLIKVPGWFVFSSAKFSLPLTEASKNSGKISQITLDQNWTYSKPGSDWSFGASFEFQPIFFSDPMPTGYTSRKTLYVSAGHLISYRISPILNIQSTSTLDFDHRSPDSLGAFNFTSNLDDTSRIAIYLSPAISNSIFISMGGYFQFLLWSPTLETSIVGFDFSISF